MKKTLLLKTMLLLCALVVGSLNGWADNYNFSFSTTTGSYDETNKTITWTDSYCSILQEKGSSSTNVSSSYIESPRWYQDHLITFTPSSGYKITSIAITGTKSGSNTYYGSTMEIKSGGGSVSRSGATTTWTGEITNTSPLVLKMGSQCRPSQVKITYAQLAIKTNTTLTLSPVSLNLSYGGSTGTLTATVTPEGGSALANPTISWESSNKSVATVAGGVVTPVGEGTAKITATYAGDDDYNESSAEATVTVTDNRTSVVSDIASIWSIKTLYIGGNIAFTPSVTLADGLSESDVTYSYVSADPTTIRINDDGTYTALKTGSNIDITVTATPVDAKAATYKPVSVTFQHSSAYKYKSPLLNSDDVTEGKFNGSMELTMANDGTPTGPIYFTIDGTEPAVDKSNCTLYVEPITLTATTTIKARVIDEVGHYSTVTTATYTKVAANKDAITLAENQTLSFTDFSSAGGYGTDKVVYLIASDGDKYKFTGTDVGNYSGKTLQIKNNTTAYITSSNITAPNGFKMNVTFTGSVYVYVGNEKQTAAEDGAYYFPTNTAVTLKRGTSSTPQVSNITFTALKPSRSVTFPDGDQEITVDGETITKTATVSPAGTATYDSSDPTVATVNATTGEVTAVKGGTAVITATVAADENYEKSTGSYTVTVNKAATTLAFEAAEQTVELVDGTATYTATATPADEARVITYSSETATVNSSTGAVTLSETGDFVIKANATATDKYLAPAEASYTLHVIDSRVPVVSNLQLVLENAADLNNVAMNDMGEISATYIKATGFDGTEVVTYASSNPTVFDIENGMYMALKGGTATVTVTVTSNGNNMFTTVEKDFVVTVVNNSKTATAITIEPDDTPINTTYGADPTELLYEVTTGYEGNIVYSLSNEAIVDVEMSNGTATITPKAVGTTTLTFSAPETTNYLAAADVVLTINVAAGTTGKATADYVEGVLEDLDFSKYYVPDSWQMTTTNSGGYQAWTNNESNNFISANGYKSGTRYAGTYDYITDEYDLTRYRSADLIFEHAGQYFGTISDGVKLFAEVDGVEEELTINNYFAGSSYSSYVKNTTSLNSLCGKKARIIFRYISDGTSTNTGRWDIKNFKISGETLPSEEITVTTSGFGTYCYQYPLDLDMLDEDVKAYIVTNVTGTDVTFTRITGTIKGGVPFILYGTEGEHTLYTAPSSTNVPEGNLLTGTLAPTYVASTETEYCFGINKTSGKFVKIKGIIPANKAYLTVEKSIIDNAGSGARELNIIFDEESGTTGVADVRSKMTDGDFYDLQGRKVANPGKGLYIVNGHKVVVK